MDAQNTKREYHPPKLEALGTLTSLTRGDGNLIEPFPDSAQYNSTATPVS